MRVLYCLAFFLLFSSPVFTQVHTDPLPKRGADYHYPVFGRAVPKTDSIIEAFNVEKLPVFPGGEKGLLAFFTQNIWWPKGCKEHYGMMAVQCVVDTLGECCSMQIVKTPAECFEPVVAAIFAKMPCWSPGEMEGRKVPVRLILPIRIRLE